MNLTSIPALQDNYIWILNDDRGQCIIIDPGEAQPVLEKIQTNRWQPQAILLTHHHNDHTDGVKALLQSYPHLTVYGPQETASKGANRIVSEGESFYLAGVEFKVIYTPGHTAGHISYYCAPWLFCGDTLFSGGCGRLFEGTAEQMYQSFQKINQLPAETLICCAHEYTLANLVFASALMPQNQNISAYLSKVKAIRAKNDITLPTTLALERQINLFFLTQSIDLQHILGFNSSPDQLWQVFAALRKKKDSF